MKTKIIILALLLTAGSFSSCKKFLELQPYGQPSELNNLSDAQAMQAVYALFYWQYREGTLGRGFMWYENCSDNFITGRTQAEAQNIKNFVDEGSHGRDVRDNWPQMYQTINYANNLLRSAPAADKLSERVRNSVLGHAYFMRGFSYLWLAPWYGDNGPNGGIPIVTEETPIDQMDVPRPSSILENYSMIIDDLQKAADLLPWFDEMSQSEWGLMHKTAAWALMARAALYAAQYDASYYDKVIEYTNRVINSGKHNLVPSYKTLFEIESNWSPEYLMSATSSEIDGAKLPGVIFQNGGFGIYNTWGYFQPTVELVKAFQPNDQRLKVSIVQPGDTVQFVGNQIVWAVSPSSVSSPSALTIGKYLAPFRDADAVGKTVNPNSDNGTTDLSIPIIRYADVLLMKAEALIWKGQNGDEPLNLVRQRAGLPAIENATKEDLKRERRCEFVLEFGVFRHLDLVRWGDAQSVYAQPLHGYKVNLSGTTITSLEEIEVWPARNFNPAIHHVFPIPNREIAKGVNLKQNNGY
ncbi:MAG: RagB/SusD family nutrient uptake outer membrane protein [Chitinophagaceae bacterium]|nr:RagB/SusD family nutrient uptake outer membrane protein [Chitinophagaceae bacterium]MCW5929177.1 RagB/SusD family nutrient uptake outer membrane protein [Chitinophagaceae bacterium]